MLLNMFTVQHALENFAQECMVLKHLASKLRPEDMDYRPTPGQRSTKELLGYLANSLGAQIHHICSGDSSVFTSPELKASTADTDEHNFASKLDAQEKSIHEAVHALSEEHLHEMVDASGVKTPRFASIVNTLVAQISAYKMQLFLYMKANGHTHLVSSNLWNGKDPENKSE
jgi:hypothetical protein